tara:strand:+ start:796 stop:1308 length:513 start_codon:yes stop_codon:yes gene_type:complete
MELLNLAFKETKKVKLSKSHRECYLSKNQCPYCLIELKIKGFDNRRKERAERKKTYFYKQTRHCSECLRIFNRDIDKDTTYCKAKVRKKKKSKSIVIGKGNDCPKCLKVMDRKTHINTPVKWHYTKWDYCNNCKHLQHYDEFKCLDWQEIEGQDKHIGAIPRETEDSKWI